MGDEGQGIAADAGPTPPGSPRGCRAGGRPPIHGAKTLRRAVTLLTTRGLDGRSKVALAVKAWKADIRADLGGDLTRQQEAVLELAAQQWVQVSSLDAWLAQQPSLVLARKRTVLPVLMRGALPGARRGPVRRCGRQRATSLCCGLSSDTSAPWM